MDTRQTRARSWMSPVPRVRGVYAAGVSAPSTSEDAHAPRGRVLALALGAVGVVYGDIGTSPLYAVNEIFFGHGHVAPTPESARGCISLVVWALIVVVALKYVLFVLRADNDGEGGVFALYGLLHRYKEKGLRYLLFALMLAAGLLFGDGVITPAISVLSAVEGLNVVTPMFEHAIVPITIVILTGLFSIQFRGTETVGRVFGPILIVGFLTIAGIGGWRSPPPADPGGPQPVLGRSLPPARRRAREPPGPRVGHAHRDRRRGALRRHGALREGAHPRRLVRARLPGAAPELPGGRARLSRAARRSWARTSSTARCRARSSCRWSSCRRSPPSSRRRRSSRGRSRWRRRGLASASSRGCASCTRTTPTRGRSTSRS